MMKIVSFVIFITIQCLCYEAIEFQEVRLPALKHDLRVQDSGRIFAVVDSRPLHIVFEDLHAQTVQCFNTNKKLIFEPRSHNFFNNGTTELIIYHVSSDMSTKWKCILTDANQSNTVYLFEIRVKAAKVVAAVIDTISLKFTLTNDSVLGYDGVKEYSCEEGETINLNCRHFYNNGSLILSYYNANGTKMIETDEVDKEKNSEDSLNFRLLMRAEADRSYVDCIYLTAADHENYRQEFTYRIIFIIKKETFRNNYFTITVNDMKLTPKPNNVKGLDIYNYNFIYGENLTVTCEKEDKGIQADIKMGIKSSFAMAAIMKRDSTHISTKDIEKNQTIYRFLVETTYLDQARIECFIYNNDSNEYLRAAIDFYKEPYDGPTIVGLPASDELYQYSKNNRKWVAHYQYTPNDTVLLTCITVKHKALRWYQGKKMFGGTKGENRKIGITYIRDVFTLNQNYITCELVDGSGSSWTLLFSRKPDLSSLDTLENSNRNALNEPANLFVIIGCTAGVLLAILTIAVYVFYWHRRHRTIDQKQKPLTNITENDNPIPRAINQGASEEYTYITNEDYYIKSDDSFNVVNSFYSGYMSNNMDGHKKDNTYSGHIENHYTEIDDYPGKETDHINPTNAVTYDNNKYENVLSSSSPSYDNL